MSLTSYRAAPPRGGGCIGGVCWPALSRIAVGPGGPGRPGLATLGGWRARGLGGLGGLASLAATCSSASSDAVPSALRVFTAEFGMGSGVWPLAVATRLAKPP